MSEKLRGLPIPEECVHLNQASLVDIAIRLFQAEKYMREHSGSWDMNNKDIADMYKEIIEGDMSWYEDD